MMDFTSRTAINVCANCGQQWLFAHVCPPTTNPAQFDGCQPVKPLNEADVRRIIREELRRCGVFPKVG